MTNYPIEVLGDDDDNGTMVDSRDALAKSVIGRKIVSIAPAEHDKDRYGVMDRHVITLDNGQQVEMVGQSDCCAYTELSEFLLHPELVDHVITGVGTTDGYTKWHIFADAGDVLELTVGWSCGNPFYYSYGFDVTVKPLP